MNNLLDWRVIIRKDRRVRGRGGDMGLRRCGLGEFAKFNGLCSGQRGDILLKLASCVGCTVATNRELLKLSAGPGYFDKVDRRKDLTDCLAQGIDQGKIGGRAAHIDCQHAMIAEMAAHQLEKF